MAALSTLRVRWSYRYRSLGSDFGCSPIYLGGINHRQSSHVEDAADRRRLGEDVRRLGGAEQDRSNRHAAGGGDPKQIVGDVRRIKTGHDEKIGFRRQARVREDAIREPAWIAPHRHASRLRPPGPEPPPE